MPLKNNKNFIILSVGGSVIIPPSGFNIEFLKQFRNLILGEVKKGKKFILVIGGGATCRNYQNAAASTAPMSNADLDWLGIKTTLFNAEFVRFLFKDIAHAQIVSNPTKKIKTSKPVIIAGGWKPGCSTDNDAVLLAKTYGASEIMNLSNVDYVYSSDPRTNPAALKYEHLTWKEFKKIVGDTWKPGANVPFDPIAAKTAERLKLKLRFVKGTDIEAVKNAFAGAASRGTIIE